jgi:hypothetical protein
MDRLKYDGRVHGFLTMIKKNHDLCHSVDQIRKSEITNGHYPDRDGFLPGIFNKDPGNLFLSSCDNLG